jgi:methyl acetate hydrolase
MSSTWASSAKDLLEAAVAGATVPGATVIVTDRAGAAEQVNAGLLSVDGDAPVEDSTMFRLMSMTKAFGSVAALQLIEQGRLSLEQEVASVLPAFAELKVLEGFDGDTPRLREPRRQATIKHLMTHTAGHGYGFLSTDLLRYHELSGVPDPMAGKLAGLKMPLIADPGTIWNYGINTDWLGQVVEAISGQDLESYLQEHVFGPLGMKDTTFAPTAEQRSRLMGIHARTPDGGLALAQVDVPIPDPEFWPSGHGAFGTAADYASFMAAILGDGELDGARILEPETVALAFSEHLDGAPLPELMKAAVPELSNDVPAPPFAESWGLGFHLFTEDLPGMRRSGSGNWAGLFNCYFWIDRTSGVASAFLTQVLPFFDARIVELTLALEQEIYAGIAAAA